MSEPFIYTCNKCDTIYKSTAPHCPKCEPWSNAEIIPPTPPYAQSIEVVAVLIKELDADGRSVLLDRLLKGYCRTCFEELNSENRCRACDAGEEGLALREAGY
jgi:hypothetical protein